jgi:putative transposase
MKKRSAETSRKQGKIATTTLTAVMHQLVLPLIVGLEATKKGMFAFVHQMGMAAVNELLAVEAASVAGPKGKHAVSRQFHHWGSTPTVVPFGGRKVVVERPRVRGKAGGEVALPTLEAFRAGDPMPARVAEQIVLGVSTRGYERSLEPVPGDVTTRGTSKSSASRALIERTAEKLSAFLTRSLEKTDIVAMFIDAIEIANKSVIIALGVTVDGTKVPLGMCLGSTENSTVATALLNGLIERGLHIAHRTLFVIDGGKGIRKGIADIFGAAAIVQRCQVHKLRNVRDYLPEARHAHVMRQMRKAYASSNPKVARKQLLQLASWLESNGDDGAAASLREGLDETLTVLHLKLTGTIQRTFATTNSIENMNGTIRRVCRNVKRWKGESMIQRWIALGVGEAERKFRRVKGYKMMSPLVAAVRGNGAVASE